MTMKLEQETLRQKAWEAIPFLPGSHLPSDL